MNRSMVVISSGRRRGRALIGASTWVLFGIALVLTMRVRRLPAPALLLVAGITGDLLA